MVALLLILTGHVLLLFGGTFLAARTLVGFGMVPVRATRTAIAARARAELTGVGPVVLAVLALWAAASLVAAPTTSAVFLSLSATAIDTTGTSRLSGRIAVLAGVGWYVLATAVVLVLCPKLAGDASQTSDPTARLRLLGALRSRERWAVVTASVVTVAIWHELFVSAVR
jgi:hypothetical protein